MNTKKGGWQANVEFFEDYVIKTPKTEKEMRKKNRQNPQGQRRIEHAGQTSGENEERMENWSANNEQENPPTPNGWTHRVS